MMEGASFGAGNAMAKMAVNSVFGGSSQHLPAEHNKGETKSSMLKRWQHMLPTDISDSKIYQPGLTVLMFPNFSKLIYLKYLS